MKSRLPLACAFLCAAGMIGAQTNWSAFGADAQRSGWERVDTRLSPANAKDIQLLWKMKLDDQHKAHALTPPVVIGRIITYRGFKELAVVGASSDLAYAIDADLAKLFWQKHLEYANVDPPSTTSTAACPGGLTAMFALTPPAPPGRGGSGRGAGGPPAAPIVPVNPRTQPNPYTTQAIFTISSDGRVHRLNFSTGDDLVQPLPFLPANVRAHSLNIAGNTLYTMTNQGCGEAPNAVWSFDLTGPDINIGSFVSKSANFVGIAGPVIGSDGTIYAQTSDTLFALTKDLKLKQSFQSESSDTSPVVFTYHDQELIVSSAKDGSLNLLDASSLAPLYRTPPLSSGTGNGAWGSLSSWEDSNGTRWVLASVWGPLNPALKAPLTGAPPRDGSVVAFKLEDRAGKLALTPAWVSGDLNSPVPPVIANGVVLVLSTRPHATLSALDALTGKELYSSRSLVATPALLNGLSVANGRVYFATTDDTLYAFGIPYQP